MELGFVAVRAGSPEGGILPCGANGIFPASYPGDTKTLNHVGATRAHRIAVRHVLGSRLKRCTGPVHFAVCTIS